MINSQQIISSFLNSQIQNNPKLQQLQTMIRGQQDPNVILNYLTQNNPDFANVVKQYRQSGMSAEQFLQSFMTQRGIKF